MTCSNDGCGGNGPELAYSAIPIAGPFVLLGTGKESDIAAPLVSLGIVQIAGAAMLVAGIAATERIIVRNDRAGKPMLLPIATGDVRGVVLVGSL
jgi:hypothetical protein